MLELALNLQRQNLINRLWQDIKYNLKTDGYLAPIAFLSISSWQLPSEFEIVANNKTFYGFTSASEDFQVLSILLDLDNKPLSMGVVQKFVTDLNAEFVVIITEAWVVEKSEEEIKKDSELALLIPPRFDPERQEIILISLQDKQGVWQSFTPITRASDGTPSIPSTYNPFRFHSEMMGGFCLSFPLI